LKGCRFDTIEAIEADSQVVLNTFKGYNFQRAFKNGRNSGSGTYMQMGTTLRFMVASRPNVSFFLPHVSTSPGNYGYALVNFVFQL
jgi:hypothetical protein